MTSRQWPKAHK